MKTKIPTEIENIDEIVELWKSNRLTTLEYLQKVSEEELLKRPEGGWSLSEVGEHLYLTQLNIARMIPVALGVKLVFLPKPKMILILEKLGLDFQDLQALKIQKISLLSTTIHSQNY